MRAAQIGAIDGRRFVRIPTGAMSVVCAPDLHPFGAFLISQDRLTYELWKHQFNPAAFGDIYRFLIGFSIMNLIGSGRT